MRIGGSIRCHEEKGAIIVMGILLLILVSTLVGFAINLGFAYASLEQARSYARLLSLNAVEQFSEIEGSGATQQDAFLDKLKKTRHKLNAVAQKNFLLANPDKIFSPLGYAWKVDSSYPTIDEEHAGGLIEPGLWFYEKPSDGDPLSRNGLPGTYPGFQVLDLATYQAFMSGAVTEAPAVNAFRIRASFNPGIPLKFASNLLGNGIIPIDAQAVSTSTPRQVIFLIDTSNSSVGMTHKRRPIREQICSPTAGRGGYYGFKVDLLTPSTLPDCDSGNPTADLSYYCQWRFLKDFDPSIAAVPPISCPDGTTTNGGYVNDGGITRVIGSSTYPNSNLIHYRDDYSQDITVMDFGDYSETKIDPNGTSVVLRDLHRHPDTKYAETKPNERYLIDANSLPEPLTSIFAGLNEAVDQFIQRATSGDQSAFTFFERKLRWSRAVPLTDKFFYLKMLSDTTDAANRERINRLGLFPSAELQTNLKLVVEEAVEQIKASPLRQAQAPSSAAIVYIGDFLGNCTNPNNPASDVNQDGLVSFADFGLFRSCCLLNQGLPACTFSCGEVTGANIVDDLNKGCRDDFSHFDAAMAELAQYVTDEMVPNKITFNTILVGDHVAPHTVDVVDPENPGQCLSDVEARRLNLDYVKGGNKDGLLYQNFDEWNAAYASMGETTPFYQAVLEAYRMVRATGGVFAPILSSPPGCVADPTGCRNAPFTSAPAYRRKVDRKCRPLRQQIEDYMKDIVRGDSPYQIVESN